MCVRFFLFFLAPHSHLTSLAYLDLTACIFAEFSIEALVDLQNLSTLILFNVWPLEHEIPTLCKFTKLHTLDISTTMNSGAQGTYTNPNRVYAHFIFCICFCIIHNWHFFFVGSVVQTLDTLVSSLPLLRHLDISGTNLAGTGVAQFKASENVRSSDIPGLVSRVRYPLEFLGLYNTSHSACRRHDIPAIWVQLRVVLRILKLYSSNDCLFRCRYLVMRMKNKF